ncbi:Asp-tRNA(Asn)/Glu-tRNA(Gln) amidotransferase subunit GatC [Candidatus Parcubacteria bacterium]|nr:Asp-tRNA(Asn)/Glu-tRNA(Gln) amidotransferase subunit GatC [Candidatus Parcubacteria bacterium]
MLTDTELDHIAKLARIELKDEEREKLKKELSSILDYVAKLNEADTSFIEPLQQITGLINSTREDVNRNEFPANEELKAKLIDQAPQHEDRLVKVKAVLAHK